MGTQMHTDQKRDTVQWNYIRKGCPMYDSWRESKWQNPMQDKEDRKQFVMREIELGSNTGSSSYHYLKTTGTLPAEKYRKNVHGVLFMRRTPCSISISFKMTDKPPGNSKKCNIRDIS